MHDPTELWGESHAEFDLLPSEPHISTPPELPHDSTPAALHGSNHPSEDDELGHFEDSGSPPDPKIHELQIAQKFIDALKDASLDNSGHDPMVIELLCNPHETTIEEDLNELDDKLNPVVCLLLDIFLAISNASQDTYTAVCAALARHSPPTNILSYDAVK